VSDVFVREAESFRGIRVTSFVNLSRSPFFGAKERGKGSLSEIETQRWLPPRMPPISATWFVVRTEIETHAIASSAHSRRFRNAQIVASGSFNSKVAGWLDIQLIHADIVR
jgi:hypothetical protein